MVKQKGESKDIKAPEGYKLVWADEFDEPGLPNAEFWSFENGFVRNEELQWYQSENAEIENGLLTIEGRRERVKNPNYQKNSGDWKKKQEYAEYTSASINTGNKFSFKYGIMEVRARIDIRRGSWPAIWTLGINRLWPNKGEVDVMELYRVNGVPHILANVAWKGEKRFEPTWDSSKIPLSYFTDRDPLWEKKFHTWRMEWDADYIRLFLDDELLNEIKVSDADYDDGFNPFKQPHYILLNLAIGSNGGDPSGTDFPLKYEVNYVRVFQKKTDE
ncbi:MAG: glycoside hydrolase family 16 protein [Bacteroidota bacterium]